MFRNVNCEDSRQDAIQECVALAYKAFLSLLNQGRNPLDHRSTLATFAARQVKSGRTLCSTGTTDVCSKGAELNRGIQFVPAHLDALVENTVTPVEDQAAFRVDFPEWLLTHTERHRRMIDVMLTGERTDAIADSFGMSPARVSQLRSEFRTDWERFQE